MTYRRDSLEARLVRDDPEAVGEVSRWIAEVVASPRFWLLRSEWPDLHQESLLRVLESLQRERFDPSRDFRAYVKGVARFTVRRARTLKLRFLRPNPHPGSPGPAAPRTAEERVISSQLVRRAMETASEECRDLIRLYFLEEKGYAEIAQARGLPVGTVKSRLFRCLDRVQRLLAGSAGRRGVHHGAAGRDQDDG